MNAHDLARKLLNLPDKPVVLHSTDDWTADIQDAQDTGTEISLGWLPQ